LGTEQKKAAEFFALLPRLRAAKVAALATIKQFHTLIQFGYPVDITVQQHISEIPAAADMAANIARKLRTKEWGVRLSSNGSDIDVLAPVGTTQEEIGSELLKEPNGFGFPVLVVVVGVVAVVGLVYAAIKSVAAANEAELRAQGIMREADLLLSSDPVKKTLWEAAKSKSDWSKNQGVIDRAIGAIGAASSTVGIGLAVGIVAFLAITALKR
jgi:hypothetical protein